MIAAEATRTTFTWKPGNKQGVSFANLSQLQRFESDTYALFKQPVFDGQKVETPAYNYRIRITKWGPSVTRFLNTSNSNNNDSIQQPQPQQSEQQPQQVSTQGSLGMLTAELSPKAKLILELKQTVNKMNSIVQELERTTNTL